MKTVDKKKTRIKGDSIWGYVFIAVALIVFCMFTLYPVISAFIISFQKYKPLGSDWIGFSNYTGLLKDKIFAKSIKKSLIVNNITF